MNPASCQPSKVSALPLLSPTQLPGARKPVHPMPRAVRQMLLNGQRLQVPIIWSCEQWPCNIRFDRDKGNQ